MELDEARIAAVAQERGFSGVIAVDVADTRTVELCRGYAHRALGAPITGATRIGIASGSKAFTALAIARLVEDGRLALDQPVRTVLGEDLPLIDDRVTIAHLLEHTSGIGEYLDESDDWDANDYVLTVPVHTLTTATSMLPVLAGHPQVFEPGARYAYHNGGYVVLGIVLERLTGEPFQDAVTRLVLEPAGLIDTGFPRLDELPGDAALGYLYPQGDRVNTLHLPVRGSADGGAYTTAADLHTFWRALLAGRIVAPETVAALTAPRHEDVEEEMHYGRGFYIVEPGRALALEGYDAGASFFTWHLSREDTTISVLGNTSEGAWGPIRVIAEAVGAYLAG